MGILEAVGILIDRLKNIDETTGAAELEELAACVDIVNESETHEDVLAICDSRKTEILEKAKESENAIDALIESRPAKLLSAKENSLSSISNEKISGEENLAQNIAEKSKEINAVVDNFATLNDVPESSTIRAEISTKIRTKSFLSDESLPIIFGVLSRCADYNFGAGVLGGDFPSPGSGSFDANPYFKLLVGAHNYTTEYAGFCKPPKLRFLQGAKGVFSWRDLYATPAIETGQYSYNRMPIGCMFVKNTTNVEITRTLTFGGSNYCYRSDRVVVQTITSGRRVTYVYGYIYDSSTGGLALSVGIPSGTTLNWSNLYVFSSSGTYSESVAQPTYAPSVETSADITIPANTTVAIMLCATSWLLNGQEGCYFQFAHWRLSDVRSQFLGNGLEIDLEMTKKAWQRSGLNDAADLWSDK